jgi:hypothetical protein
MVKLCQGNRKEVKFFDRVYTVRTNKITFSYHWKEACFCLGPPPKPAHLIGPNSLPGTPVAAGPPGTPLAGLGPPGTPLAGSIPPGTPLAGGSGASSPPSTVSPLTRPPPPYFPPPSVGGPGPPLPTLATAVIFEGPKLHPQVLKRK